MSIRKLAEEDLGLIVENPKDFGWPIKVTNPEGVSENFIGISGDIALVIDPDTGDPVSGRLVQVSLRISSLTAKCFKLPVAIAESTSKPWVIEFESINGKPGVFKVSHSNPDRTLGLVKLNLEVYKKKAC